MDSQHPAALIAAILAGVAGAAATIYALGVLTVGVSVRAAYADTFALAWHAVSLMPKTTVAVYGFTSLLWALCTALISVLFVLGGLPLLCKLGKRNSIGGNSVPPWLAPTIVVIIGFVLLLAVFLSILGFFTDLSSINANTEDDLVWQEWAVLAYLALTIIGCLASAGIVHSWGFEYESNDKFIPSGVDKPTWLVIGLLSVYCFAWLGAFFLSAAKLPPLPQVVLVQSVGEEQTVGNEQRARNVAYDTPLELEESWRQCHYEERGRKWRVRKGRLLAEQQGNWYLFTEDTCKPDQPGTAFGQYDHDFLVVPESEENFLEVLGPNGEDP